MPRGEMDVPVMRLFQGQDFARVDEKGATTDPLALEWFAGLAKTCRG